MTAVFRSIQEMIGQTPILELTRIGSPSQARLFAKLEMANPGGSIKDRLGLALLRHGEKTGKLRPGGTIIEPTAGNTGIGLALAAIGTNYRVIFVVPERFSEEKQELMRALGAEVINTPMEEGMQGAIKKAHQLTEQIPEAYCPEQFSNPSNPLVHYETTAPELWTQLSGRIDVFVAGAGSAGTFMGVARFLKEKDPQIRCVIVEPEGSILGGGQVGPHQTEGIGMERLPDFFRWDYVDQVYTVSDEDAFAAVKELAQKEGLFVGSSSGAAYYAAVQEAKQCVEKQRIAVIFPDSSERYLSKNIYQGGIKQ